MTREAGDIELIDLLCNKIYRVAAIIRKMDGEWGGDKKAQRDIDAFSAPKAVADA